MKELIERLRREDSAARDEVLRRWNDWTADDVAALKQIARDLKDPHEPTVLRDAWARLQVLRALGPAVNALWPGLDSVFLDRNVERRCAELEKRMQALGGQVSEPDRRVLQLLAREYAPEHVPKPLLDLVRERPLSRVEVSLEALRHPVPEVRVWAIGEHQFPHRDWARNVVALLRDPEPEVRQAAAGWLGWYEFDEFAEEVGALLDDPSPTVVAAAATAVAELAAFPFSLKLKSLLSHPDLEVRRAAECALGELGIPMSWEEAEPLLASPDDHRRRAAFERFVVKAKRKDCPRIIPFLKDSSEVIRREAVSSLHRIAGRTYWRLFAEMTEDSSGWVRREALWSLVGCPLAQLEPILHRLVGDPDWNVRQAVVWRLWTRPWRRRWREFLRHLDGKRAHARSAVLWMLGHVRNRKVLDAVRPLLSHADPKVRGAAVEAAAGSSGPAAAPDVLLLAADPDAGVRERTGKSLGKLGRRADLQIVRRLLKDPEPRVRVGALEGTKGLKDRRLILEFARCSRDADPEVRRESMSALAAALGPRAASFLVRAQRDPDHHVRLRAVLEARRHLRAEAAVVARAFATDQSPDVSALALGILAAAGDTTAAEASLASPSGRVQEASAGGLAIAAADSDLVLAEFASRAEADPGARAAAIRALASRIRPKAVERAQELLFRNLTRNASHSVRAAAGTALIRLGLADAAETRAIFEDVEGWRRPEHRAALFDALSRTEWPADWNRFDTEKAEPAPKTTRQVEASFRKAGWRVEFLGAHLWEHGLQGFENPSFSDLLTAARPFVGIVLAERRARILELEPAAEFWRDRLQRK